MSILTYVRNNNIESFDIHRNNHKLLIISLNLPEICNFVISYVNYIAINVL